MYHLNADTQHTTHILSKRWSKRNIAVVVTQPHCCIVSSVSSCFYAETIELSVLWCKRQIFIWLKQYTRRRKAIMKREKELQTIFLWISRLKKRSLSLFCSLKLVTNKWIPFKWNIARANRLIQCARRLFIATRTLTMYITSHDTIIVYQI